MNRKILATAICAGLFMTGGAWAQDNSGQTQDQSTSAQPQKEKKTLQAVIVTGSLIPQAEIETASPVIKITAADLAKQGFATAYDALKATPVANGGVQGNQSSGGFTQGAQTISLFGLPPNYTLFLINGKQMTNYPLAYNGSNAFTDLANIPVAMIDHIDIVPGGNSAIYGSAAIAGVVNIVLKEKYQGVDLNYRVGGYTQGGGQNERLQLSGGGTWGKLDASFSLELLNQHPIFASQRSTTDSLADDPTLNGAPPLPSRSFLVVDILNGDGYVDPGAGTCAGLSYLFNHTTGYAYRPPNAVNNGGYYCGTTGTYGATSLLNGNKSGSAYTNLVYHFNDYTEAYAQILFSSSAPKFNIGGNFQFWQSNEDPLSPVNSYFWNDAVTNPYGFNGGVGSLQTWQHFVAPEEYGGSSGAGAETIYTRNLNAALGVRGSFGPDSNWNYDAYYNRSQANTDDSYRHFIKSAIDNYYLGPQLGTVYGYPLYNADPSKLYTPLTPAIFDSLTARIDNKSVAWNQNLNFTVTNGSLFSLPAGDVGFAATVQAGQDQLHNPIPPLIASGDALGLTGSEASGSRKNYGIGTEFRIPVFKMLTADLSGRYDNYRFAGNSASKFTYKLGLEFRPWDNLLLRGNYATAFRAPDLVNVFGSNGFYEGVTDYYLCRTANPSPFPTCSPTYDTQIFGTNGSSSDLQDVTAKTLTYGFDWSPLSRMNFSVDYQRVEIKNEVAQLSVDQLLRNEADCLLGETTGGAPIDPNSPSCQLYESLVQRAPPTSTVNPNGLITVTTYPINVSTESESGIVANAGYTFDMGRAGTLALSGNYYVEFQHKFQQFPGDPVINVYHDPRYTDWKSTFNGSATWNIGNWSTTLFAQRYGSVPNWGETGTLPPWILWNASVKYNVAPDAAIQVTVNNLFDKMPPVDKTNNAFPYYNTYNYNPYGRAVWAEFAIHFGGH